jgi:hypothetical protein
MGKIPVVITRMWDIPSQDQLAEFARLGVIVHASICALDSDGFLDQRREVCEEYLRLGGVFVWRAVSFGFDDTMDEGIRLDEKQDFLLSGEFGKVGDEKPLVLETPARLMKGKKQRNPNWEVLAEWAYFKAPSTKDHKFTPMTHNWTAGVQDDEKDACWYGCHQCPNQCMVTRVFMKLVQDKLAR